MIGRWISVDPLADHPKQTGMSPYSAFWNNPIRYNDPDGRCPECEENVKDPTDGQIYTSTGGSEYTFDKGEWTRNGGMLNVVTVTASRSDNGEMTDFSNSNLALTFGGAIYGGLEGATASQGYWLGENAKYYPQQWGGNQYTGSRAGAFKAANAYRLAGRATVIGLAGIGVYATIEGYQLDGGQFGYNAQRAVSGSAGGIVGGVAGSKGGALIGASIGVWFGGVGAVPGEIIGGVIGGIGGSIVGEKAGESAVDRYHKR